MARSPFEPNHLTSHIHKGPNARANFWPVGSQYCASRSKSWMEISHHGAPCQPPGHCPACWAAEVSEVLCPVHSRSLNS
jgi:hypothetical protein